MGLLNNIREFFSNSKSPKTTQVQVDDKYEKSILAEKIVDLVYRIQRIDSFDSSIWNLTNTPSYELEEKSLNELQRLNSTLENKLSELTKRSQKRDPSREALEAAKWTGQKPSHMSDLDFDRFQRSDDSR